MNKIQHTRVVIGVLALSIAIGGLVILGVSGVTAQQNVDDNSTSTGEGGTQQLGLQYGDAVTSELDENDAFDEDLNGYHEKYTFEGEIGDQISIEMRPSTGPFDPSHAAMFIVYGPDGDRIETGSPQAANGYADTFDNTDDDIPESTFTLEESGTYTIVATTDDAVTDSDGPDNPAYETPEESHTDTFEYELRIHEFVGEATSIEYNSLVEDALTQQSNYNDQLNGYYDVYSFEGERGDRIAIEMRPEGEAFDASHAARFIVYGPNGEKIETGVPQEANGYADTFDNTRDDIPESTFTLEESGSYTIVVTSDDPETDADGPENPAYESFQESHTDTFKYQLRLHEFVGEATSIEYDSTVEDALTQQSNYNDQLNGYYDVYSFEGDRGDRISVEMRPEGGPFNKTHAGRFTIYDPNGEKIETGTTQEANGYADTFDNTRDDIPDSTFTLEESGTYTIVVTTDDPETDADGPENPAYETFQESNTDIFNYQLRLHEFVGEATSIEYNSPVEAAITQQSNYNDQLNGYYDVYSFEAEQGDRISVEMRPDGGPFDASHAARFMIYGPNGEQIETGIPQEANGYADTLGDTGNDISDSTFALDNTGNYTIVVTTDDPETDAGGPDNPAYEKFQDSNTDTFEYELRVHEFVGEPTSIEYDSAIEDALTLQSNYNDQLNGYYDVYSFEGDRGDRISVEMRPDGGPFGASHAARFMIYGPNGEQIETGIPQGANGYADTSGDTGNDIPDSAFTLEKSGTHTIVATSDDPETDADGPENPAYETFQQSQTDTFEYELRVHEFVGEATSIEYNSPVEDALTPQSNYNDQLNGYYDIYSFEAERGDKVWMQMSLPNGSLAENHATRLKLYDTNGDLETTSYTDVGNSSVEGISLSEGVYTVVATSGDTDSDGAYTTYQESLTATFDYNLQIVDGPTAAFTVSPQEDGSVRFDAEASSLPGGAISEYKWDFDGDGTTETTTPDPEVTHTYDEEGTYTVELTVVADDGVTTNTTTDTVNVGDRTLSVSLSPSTITTNDSADVTISVTEEGSPVEGATVEIPEFEFTGETDSNGEITLSPVDPTPGEYTVSVSAEGFSDETATLTVEADETEIVITDSPATDTTGDGLLNDIDGDGEFTIFDIQALFNNLELINEEYPNSTDRFNFSGNDPETVTIFDVQALFSDLQ